MSQNLTLVIIGEKPTFGALINFSNELHTAVSVSFSVPSSVASRMAYTALTYSLTADPIERGGVPALLEKKIQKSPPYLKNLLVF